MRNIRVEIPKLGGMQETFPQPPDSCVELENFTIDRYTMGWSNKIGFERYFPQTALNFDPFGALNRIDSVFVWDRHSGAQQIVLLESGGALSFLHDIYSSAPVLIDISEPRTVPANDEAPTQYTPFGRWLVITNGYEAPIRFAGWPMPVAGTAPYIVPSYPLGWISRPLPPNAWQVILQNVAGGFGVDISDKDGVLVYFKEDEVTATGQTTGSADAYQLGVGFVAQKFKDISNNDAGTHNAFRYKVSYVSNSGSESPMSDESNTVQWRKDPLHTPANRNRYAIYIEIPKGPNGTVARRLYRTKNFGETGSGTETDFYFLDEVRNNTDTEYWDIYSSTNLGSLAPVDSDSIPFPSNNCRFTAVYGNCLFIDGGSDNDNVLYYSNPGKPDQYSGTGFIDLGNTQLGGITGLHPYFNFLLVFRERGIEAISGQWPNFALNNISSNTGTRAINTITTVPGVGVVFLADDGVHAISGNMEYSDSPGISKITSMIMKTERRINKDCIARATAAYSSKTNEWHCYLPADGQILPSLGLVLHLDKSVWSTRKGFPVGCLHALRGGTLLFGHNSGFVGVSPQRGLFVISARRCLGQTLTGGATGTPQDEAPPTSRFRSSWMDMGDATLKKKIHFVYLYVLTRGDNTIPMTVFKDFGYTGQVVTARELQRPDHSDQNVYETVTVDAGSETPWEEPFVTTVRYPVALASCSWFQFEVETSNDMTLVGYSVEYTASFTRTIAGKKS